MKFNCVEEMKTKVIILAVVDLLIMLAVISLLYINNILATTAGIIILITVSSGFGVIALIILRRMDEGERKE